MWTAISRSTISLYGELLRLAKKHSRHQDDAAILSLLLYTENTVAIGLDGVYEYMYRSLGDVVFHWCDGLGMDANATSQVHNLVSQAVAEARTAHSDNGLRKAYCHATSSA